MEVERQKRLEDLNLLKKRVNEQEFEEFLDMVAFENSELILQSSLSSTYKCVLRDNQPVAVKILELGLTYSEGQTIEEILGLTTKAFDQEVSIRENLDHPNIIKLIKISSSPSIHYMISEYLSGGTLKSYLIKNSKKKLPLKIAIELALDLARGVSYLHSKKIIHRNLKCENLHLDDTRKLKIADFGVACLENSILSEVSVPIGTLGYMAPEVLQGKPYDTKADVYSFGICLWEIFCCKLSFDPKKFVDVPTAIANKDSRPKIPKDCPSPLAKIMTSCWSSDATVRPQMNDVVTSLESIHSSIEDDMKPRHKASCLCFLQRQ